MIECEPTVMDSNEYGRFYVRIFQMDYLRGIINDPSFPTLSNMRSDIEKIKKTITLSRGDLYILDAIVVEEPDIYERHVGKNIVQYIDTLIADGPADDAKIKLVGRCDFASDLHEGDRIKVVGACAIPEAEYYGFDGDYEITSVELRLSPYSSIIRGETLNQNIIDKVKKEEIIQKAQLKNDYRWLPPQGRILANVEISKSRICIIPERTVALAVNFGVKSILARKLRKIKRICQFALLSNQIQETEMFEYEINEGDDGLLTSIVILNYGNKERLDEILEDVKLTLAAAIYEKEFFPTYGAKRLM